MARFTDSTYLLRDQYRDESNLDIRIALHERFGTNPYGWHRWLFDRLALERGRVVLEVGCGSGALWLKNLERVPSGCDLLLTDLSPGMADAARRRLGERGFAPRFAVVDAQALPLRKESVDLAVANHMLYHVPDCERALRELRRVLRPNGRLVAATNGFAHLRELDALVERFAPDAERHADAGRFGLETGAALLGRYFPKVETLRYDDSLAVTDSTPLVDYIVSIVPGGATGARNLEALRSHVEETIAGRGAFHVSKDAGVLVASA